MRRAAAATAAALAVAIALLVYLGADGSARPTVVEAARADATRFLDRFVDGDGRVVRRDQGGDTVSEGQAYAMLLAVAARDEQRFDRVWRWTREHLQRRDGLLAWHWQDGRVTDDEPAADADLDAAHALTLAAVRFHRAGLRREAKRIARALVAHETIAAERGWLIAAGPWARAGRVVNPSYVAPRAFAALAAAGRAGTWRAGARTGRRLVAELSARGKLPPDWARAPLGGRARPSGAPSGGRKKPVFGWDAVRIPIRLAAACDRRSRRLAARLWPRLRSHPGTLPRTLNGAPASDAVRTPVALAGTAAAAFAAGRHGRAGRLLDRASAIEESSPTYYGSALVALTRAEVTTGLLGGCR